MLGAGRRETRSACGIRLARSAECGNYWEACISPLTAGRLRGPRHTASKPGSANPLADRWPHYTKACRTGRDAQHWFKHSCTARLMPSQANKTTIRLLPCPNKTSAGSLHASLPRRERRGGCSSSGRATKPASRRATPPTRPRRRSPSPRAPSPLVRRARRAHHQRPCRPGSQSSVEGSVAARPAAV